MCGECVWYVCVVCVRGVSVEGVYKMCVFMVVCLYVYVYVHIRTYNGVGMCV